MGSDRFGLAKFDSITIRLIRRGRGRSHGRFSSIRCPICSIPTCLRISSRKCGPPWLQRRGTPIRSLMKRPERMTEVLSTPEFDILSNVWLGTSVEDGRVLSRLNDLRRVPAAIRFVSLEPLIGSVAKADFTDIDWLLSAAKAVRALGRWTPPGLLRSKNVPQIGHSILFQTMGRQEQESSGPDVNGQTYDEMPVSARSSIRGNENASPSRSLVR